jgi:hypothetical protein
MYGEEVGKRRIQDVIMVPAVNHKSILVIENIIIAFMLLSVFTLLAHVNILSKTNDSMYSVIALAKIGHQFTIHFLSFDSHKHF